MPRPHSLPKRRGLTVAVQLALTFAAGLYAPRARSQQIACPASGVTITGAATNSVDPCDNAGGLAINSGGTLTNTGTVRTLSGGTFSNSGTLTNNGLGALTIDTGGTLENNSGGLLNNNATGFAGNDGGMTVRGTLKNDAGGVLNNSGRLRSYRTIDNDGTLTNSAIMTVYGGSGELRNNSGGTLNNDAFLTLRSNGPLLENRAGGTVNNNGTLRLFDATRVNNGPGAAIFNNNSGATLVLTNSTDFLNNGTLNNSGAINVLGDSLGCSVAGGCQAQFRNYGTFNNSGSLTNRSNGFIPDPTNGGVLNRGTLTNDGLLINYASLVNSAATLINNGSLINYAGTLYNRASGAPTTIVNNASLENRADFVNGGDLTNSAGAMFFNSGTLRIFDFSLGRVFNNEGFFSNGAGGLLINTGRLNNTGTLYNSSGYMGPGGTIDNSGTLDNSGLIQNNGALTNSGTLTSGALSYGGPYAAMDGGLVNSGTLTNTGTLTTSGVINSGTLSNSGTFTNNDTLKNYGQIDNLSGGTLGNAGNLFNFATLNNTGTLNNTNGLSNYGALNNLAGGIVNNSGYLLNYSGSTLTNGGTLNNTGYLVNFGGATLTNNSTLNNNFYLINLAGATLTNNGTLNNNSFLANVGTMTNTAGATLNNSGYLVNASGATLDNAGTLYNSGGFANAGTITNTGTLTVAAGGQLVDNGTIVQNAGTLRVDGTLAQSAVTINGGTLTGTGAITAPVTINSGGALQPGAVGVPGTLAINGSLTHNSGAVLVINATPSQTSRVTVNGAASVAGSVQLVAGAGTYPTTPQTILSATGGVSGTFSGVTATSAFLTPSLSYDPNNVFLSFYQSATFDSVAMTPNQTAVSTLLGAVQAGGGASADLQAALNTLSGLSAEQARAAYDSLGGAASASAGFKAQFSMADGFMRALTNRLRGAGSGGLTAMLPVKVASTSSNLDLSPATAREGAWVLGYGNDGKTNGDANAAGYRQDGVGIAFGADTTLSREWRIGAAVNAGTQRADLDAGAGNVKTDGVSLAGYARYSAGPFVLDSIAGIGRNDNKSTRAVDVGGISRTANADYHSDQQFAYVEASYRAWQLEPVAALGYIRVKSPSYTETSAGGLSLSVDGQARESIKSYLGVRSVHQLGLSLKLTARALWSHEFGDADSALSSARFTGAPGVGAFQTNGVALKRDGALFSLGLSGELQKNLSLFGDVAVEARQNQWNATLFAGARYAW